MLLKSKRRVLVAAPPTDVVAAFPQLVGNAVVVSESVLHRHLFTTARVYQRTLRLDRRLGEAWLTGDVPNSGNHHLDEHGIARCGSLVRRNDILAGAKRLSLEAMTSDSRLLHGIFGGQGDEVVISLVYPHDDPGVVLGHQVQSRLTGICTKCGEVPLGSKVNPKCPGCGSPFTQVKTNDALTEDQTLVLVEYVVRRELAVGDVLRTPDRRRLTVAATVPEAEMPKVDNQPVDVLLHPDLNAAESLHKPGRFFHPSLRDTPDASRHGRWDRLRLKKVTLHLERKCEARAVGGYDVVTQQPLVRGHERPQAGNPAQRLTRDDAAGLLRAGFAVNLAEMLTVKSDDIGGREAALAATVKGGVLGRSEEGPEAPWRMMLLLQAAGFHATWPPAADMNIRLATAGEIRGWSSGVVRSGDAFHPRSFRPVKDGLFCERIFGPERDWECACGKYRGVKYNGMVCDRCGVKVTRSFVRRRRMGHVELAAPVVHPWFYVTTNTLADALDLPRERLTALIHLRKDLLADPTGGQIVGPKEAERTVDPATVVKRGGDAVRHLLEARGLTRLLPAVLECLPVLPPGLRSDLATAGNHRLFAHYRSVISANAYLLKVIHGGHLDMLLFNGSISALQSQRLEASSGKPLEMLCFTGLESLQSAVNRLFVGAKHSPVCLKSELAEAAGHLVNKSVDYSARGTAVPDAAIEPGRIGLPRAMAARLFGPVVIRLLIESGRVETLKAARRLVERNDEAAAAALPIAVASRPLLVLGSTSVPAGLRPVLAEGEALRLHPDDGCRLGLTYAGDVVTLHLPLTEAAAEELSRPTPCADAVSSLSDLTAVGVVQAAASGQPLTLTGLDRIALGLVGQVMDAPVVSVDATPITPPKPPPPTDLGIPPTTRTDLAIPPPTGPAIPLAELGLSVRATNCLESEGITTVHDLVIRTAEELLDVRNFGQSTLEEVRKKLAKLGLRLCGE